MLLIFTSIETNEAISILLSVLRRNNLGTSGPCNSYLFSKWGVGELSCTNLIVLRLLALSEAS